MAAGDSHSAASIAALLKTHPDHGPDALHILGVAAAQQGDRDDALDFMLRAVNADPNNIERRLNYGAMALELGATEVALRELEQVVKTLDNNASVLTLWGDALSQAGRYEEAINAQEKALNLVPNHPKLWANLANIYLAWGKLEAAEAGHCHAVSISPSDPDLHYQLGGTRVQLGQLEAAEDAYRQAISLDPHHAKAHTSLGVLLRIKGEADAALDAHKTAYEIAPEDVDVRWNLGVSSLYHGQWEAGWALYEARRERKPQVNREGFGVPWNGDPHPEATLVIEREQGFGDLFMFCRFLDQAAERVGQLIFRCHENLYPLMKQALRSTRVEVAPFELKPYSGLYAPLLSLPHLLGLGGHVQSAPYLEAPADRVEAWGQRLGPPTKKLRVGLVWQGNPGFAQDKYRSIPLKNFAPLLALKEIDVISLQQTHGLEQLAACPPQFRPRSLGDDVDAEGAFLDTAAIFKHLDLLVTIDSAAVHLAGAMGIPCALLLRDVPDWRWGQGAQTWYDSVTPFAQNTNGNWSHPINALTEYVRSLAANRRD